jgi:hypothetical protein
MNDSGVTTPVGPMSYTKLGNYLDCPRSYELSRVQGVKRRPGTWFPAGTAVHSTIERYLRAQLAQDGGAQ